MFQRAAGKKGGRKTSTSRPAVRPQKWATRGHYQGRFAKLSKRSGRSYDKFNRSGWHTVVENIGSVTDVDCCYLMNSSANSKDVLYYTLAALIRKLFQIGGIRLTGINESVGATTGGATSGINLLVRLVSINLQTGLETATPAAYPVTTLVLVSDIVTYFMPFVEDYCAGAGKASDFNMEAPYKIVLLDAVPTTVAYEVVRSEILLHECDAFIKTKSVMKVQNRTKATGGSEDAENINNNPLQGKIYWFQGLPKPKNIGKRNAGLNSAVFPFLRMPYPNEVFGFGSSTGGFDPEFREPPSPGHFYNCKMSAKVRLEPGAIKTYTVHGARGQNILKLWRSLRIERNASSTFIQHSSFPCQMIALEDVINANAAENISVQYEVERELGAFVSIKKKMWTKTHYAQNIIP